MNCLYTLNVKNKQGFNTRFTSDRVRASFIDACYRWGCNYAEVNHDHERNRGDKICNWAKILGPKLLIGYEKLLYLDSDMIISDHAPNPFELCVEPETVYAVADAQGNNSDLNQIWKDCIYGAKMDAMIGKFPHFRKPYFGSYFNSGFMMFHNTPRLRQVFDLIDQNREFEAPTCYDQTVINMFVHNMLKVKILPETWNRIAWAREPDPQAFINHHAHVGPSL